MENTTAAANGMDFDGYFLQKKMEVLIEAQSKKMAKEFESIHGIIGSLRHEIAEIRRNFSQRQSTAAVAAEPARIAEEEKPSVVITRQERPAQQPQQRFGNTKPEDVSIDKFFYFGSKK